MKLPKKYRIPFGEDYTGNYMEFSSVHSFHEFVTLQASKLQPKNAAVLDQIRWQAERKIGEGT